MAHWKLHVLGPPRLEHDDQPVELNLRKAMALFVYLAVTGQPHSRDALATLLWPDDDQREGRASLRRTLHRLSQSIGSELLESGAGIIRLHPDADVWLDCTVFQQHATVGLASPEAEASEAERLAHLAAAAELYADDFLAGFTLPDSPSFDEWQFFQRERLRGTCARVLDQLTRIYQGREDWDVALGYARRWLTLDPLHEPAHRALMELYAQAGQQAAALRQYWECARVLDAELKVAPEQATTDLFEAIRAKRFPPPRPAPSPAEVASQDTAPSRPSRPVSQLQRAQQHIRFCICPDGVRIAYATVGQGPPLVKAANWLSHLEFEWQSPVWRHWLDHLSRNNTLIRYDMRGCGLSDWNVKDVSLEARVQDLETVVAALGLDRFPLLGISGGGAVAIAYAARHPEKVSHLILYGAYARGRFHRNYSPQEIEAGHTFLNLMKLGWGQDNPAFRQLFTSLFMPEATAEQMNGFNDLQRMSCSPENAVLLETSFFNTNVNDQAPRVAAPTLILHARDDGMVPFEEGRHLAALIPDARFVPLDSKNHLMLESEPAWGRFVEAVDEFVNTPTERRKPQRPLNTPTDSRLPASATPFIGREKELAELKQLLFEPTTRLVTVLGPGGIGKTRLALEVAREMANVNAFQDGVYFVALAPLKSAAHIAPALADQIGFRFYPGGEPEQQVLDYLSGKHMLLVFDNFEHLLSDSRRMSDPSTTAQDEKSNGAPFIAALLQAAPNVKIISTSRERLNLSSEAIFTVRSMDFPDQGSSQHALEFGAIQLLMQSARLVRPDLETHSFQPADLARICQLVHGMPLAIILAAGWIEAMSFREIAEELQHSLDFLQSHAHDLPERQRSMRATFDYSWKQLTEEERRAFMALSVFRGGFTRHAAVAVTGASLWTLRNLVQKSFLTLRPDDRYDIHELLRQYGEERLDASIEAAATRDAHGEYYLALLRQREADLHGNRQVDALDEIEADLENVRSAWGWVLSRRDESRINCALESLYLFFTMRSRYPEGVELLWLARKQFAPLPDQQPVLVWSRILARLARYRIGSLTSQDDHGIIAADLEMALAVAQAHDVQTDVAFSLLILGCYYTNFPRDYAKALDCFKRSFDLLSALNDRFYAATVMLWLAAIRGYTNDLDGARAGARQCLELSRSIGDTFITSVVLNVLVNFTICLGEYAEAERCCREVIELHRAIHLQWAMGEANVYLGLLRLLDGNMNEAGALIEQGLKLAEGVYYPRVTAIALAAQGLRMNIWGNHQSGSEFCERSLAIPSDDSLGIALAHWGLAVAHCGLRTWETAWKHLQEALRRAREYAAPAMLTWPLPVAATLLAHWGEMERAVELLALADTHPLSPKGWMEQWPLLVEMRSKLEAELGAQAYSLAWERGKQSVIEEVAAELMGASSLAA